MKQISNEDLIAYAEGDLEDKRYAQVEQALREEPKLQEKLLQILRLQRTLRSNLEAFPTAEVEDAIWKHIQQDLMPKKQQSTKLLSFGIAFLIAPVIAFLSFMSGCFNIPYQAFQKQLFNPRLTVATVDIVGQMLYLSLESDFAVILSTPQQPVPPMDSVNSRPVTLNIYTPFSIETTHDRMTSPTDWQNRAPLTIRITNAPTGTHCLNIHHHKIMRPKLADCARLPEYFILELNMQDTQDTHELQAILVQGDQVETQQLYGQSLGNRKLLSPASSVSASQGIEWSEQVGIDKSFRFP